MTLSLLPCFDDDAAWGKPSCLQAGFRAGFLLDVGSGTKPTRKSACKQDCLPHVFWHTGGLQFQTLRKDFALASFYLAFASAAAILISITASQTLLAASVAA